MVEPQVKSTVLAPVLIILTYNYLPKPYSLHTVTVQNYHSL